MLKTWETAVPLKRRIKSDKFIYKSQHRGFVFDESYKRVVVYFRPDNAAGIDLNLEDVVQEVEYEGFFFEVVVTKRYLITISLNFCVASEVFWRDLTVFTQIDCCLSVIRADALFSGNVMEEETSLKRLFSFRKHIDVDMALESGSVIYARSMSMSESGKILLSRNVVCDLWQSTLNVGMIPVCIEELQRLGLENEYIIYPFDYPNTSVYRDFERCYVMPMKAKYDRTPKSKKVSFDTELLHVYTERFIIVAMFELEKGCADRCAVVFDDNKEVGRVIRGSFCFSKGLCAGVCYIFQEVIIGDEFYTKNLNSTIFNQIRITKIFKQLSMH